jgi:hypothetical protein
MPRYIAPVSAGPSIATTLTLADITNWYPEGDLLRNQMRSEFLRLRAQQTLVLNVHPHMCKMIGRPQQFGQ